MISRSKYRKKERQPQLTEIRKKRRVAWAKYMTWKAEWKYSIVMRKNSIYLGRMETQDILQTPTRRTVTNHLGCVWFSEPNKSCIPYNRLPRSSKYFICHLLGRWLVINFGHSSDNVSIHVAKFTWQWFLRSSVHIMEWPANFSDLNPFWGVLRRTVYAGGKQYTYCWLLRTAIISGW